MHYMSASMKHPSNIIDKLVEIQLLFQGLKNVFDKLCKLYIWEHLDSLQGKAIGRLVIFRPLMYWMEISNEMPCNDVNIDIWQGTVSTLTKDPYHWVSTRVDHVDKFSMIFVTIIESKVSTHSADTQICATWIERIGMPNQWTRGMIFF